jgi:phosphate transport system ATP-binding protein
MQQAQRVSDQTAFFLAENNNAGYVVESGSTTQIFSTPKDTRTEDYVSGRFG